MHLSILTYLLLVSSVPACQAPGSASHATTQTATMRDRIERLRADEGSLERFYDVRGSSTRRERMHTFYEAVLAELDAVDVKALALEDAIDWTLLTNRVRHEVARLAREEAKGLEVAPLVPIADRLAKLCEARQRVDPLDPAAAASELDALEKELIQARKATEAHPTEVSQFVANRAAGVLDGLRRALDDWYGFRAGYDAEFTWWNQKPNAALRTALEDYARYLRETIVGLSGAGKDKIVGDPIGREALVEELQFALIPYTPEELFDIGERELAWCEQEMKKASAALGYGDDWKKALEHVKDQFVPPGEQPKLVKELADETIRFLEERDLITIPPLARETWRMSMLSPEAQKTNPFFLGGEEIQVSYPTDSMTQEQKLQSLRANNRYFSRAVVHHELIPGHRLQDYYENRYQTQRGMFSTPFWTEGWALYWEMLLWDQGFARTPEEKVGMLFWRMHRCARIRFSLGFHLGKLTAQECIDLLVDRVGHERDSATGEVRRSFAGGYGPLYQCAYMLGGLQLRALHIELVDAKTMTERAFHDGVMQGGNMPIEMVRARLTQRAPSRDWKPTWRFYDGLHTR